MICIVKMHNSKNSIITTSSQYVLQQSPHSFHIIVSNEQNENK